MICLINRDKLLRFKIGTSPIVMDYTFTDYWHSVEVMTDEKMRELFQMVIKNKRNVLVRAFFKSSGLTVESLITPKVVELNHQIKI